MAMFKKCISALLLTVMAAFLFTSMIGCDDPVVQGSNITEDQIIGSWTAPDVVGTQMATYSSDGAYSLVKDNGITQTEITGSWSLSGKELSVTIEGVTIAQVYIAELDEDKLTLTIKGTSSEEVWTKKEIEIGGTSVELDKFEINKLISNANIGEKDYTNQTLLGLQLGGYVDLKQDSLTWGGGHWYPVASGNGAKVSTFGENAEEIVILDSAETGSNENEATDADMAQLFGDDSMTVVLDCKGLTGDYWAAVGVNLAGDPEHITLDGGDIDGLIHIADAKNPEGGTVDALCWDLSNLVSITIEGKVQGTISFHLTGVKSDKNTGTVAYEIAGGAETLDSITTTFNVSEFTPAGWGGANWSDIKAQVHELALELATEKDDYASIKLNAIIFNFDTKANKEATFPFLAE